MKFPLLLFGSPFKNHSRNVPVLFAFNWKQFSADAEAEPQRILKRNGKEYVVLAQSSTSNPTSQTRIKRKVFLDGLDMSNNYTNNNGFEPIAIRLAMEVFEREGHLVQAVLPPSVSGHHNLSDLLLAGKIIEVEDDNPHSLGELILRLATEQDAAVISNNNFASYFYRYRDVVDGRVCGYVWFENSLYVVTDPYGRYRPKLDSILNK